MANRILKVSLETVAKEKLAKHILEAIDNVEIEVPEDVESGLSLDIGKRTIKLRLNYTLSTTKFLVWRRRIATAIMGAIPGPK